MRGRLENLEKLAGEASRAPLLIGAKMLPAIIAGILALIREIINHMEGGKNGDSGEG